LRPLVRVLGGAAVVVAGCGACVPSEPASPIAIRTGPDGSPVISLVDCDRVSVTSVELVKPRGVAFDDNDPRIWRIRFPRPEPVESITLGLTPVGATEVTPWRGMPPGNADLVVLVRGPKFETSESFRRSDLSGGRTRFQEHNLTATEFAGKSKCG
jgi:hypothetical protein